MLHIFYGRENFDKEKFMFQQIKGKTLLLVPDQFSLQAEKDAFFYLKKRGLMDLRIVDFSTLGYKIANEAGGKKPDMIDRYGRHMLLTKIMEEVGESLGVYRKLVGRSSFITMISNLISDMKLYQVGPEDLDKVLKQLDEKRSLRGKLEDIRTIYAAYEARIEGKYLDSDDLITFYDDKISKAPMVTESEIWIYGYDSFTPKNLLVIKRLVEAARKVNIVLTYEPDNEMFGLTRYVIELLKDLADGLGQEAMVTPLEGEARKTVWQDRSGITLAETSNIYTEAERAAAYILQLVRDEGYRFGDIVLVCNDMEYRGRIFQRTFRKWGIPVFVDKKRKVLHHPAIGFLIAVMEIIVKGYRSDIVMRLIKTGFLDFSTEEAEALENYAAEFKIKGRLWKEPFHKKGEKYKPYEIEKLEHLRQVVTDAVEGARAQMGQRNTAGEKIDGLYRFLEQDFQIRDKLEHIMKRQEAAGLSEGAAETAQSWNILCNIFDQIREIVGDEIIKNEELLKLMIAGFEKIEIGLVPVTSDRVIMGTLQRTRLSRVKALLVVGANQGILPLEQSGDGLLSENEKEVLEELSLQLSKRDHVLKQEEELAIYRTFFLPEERLYVSCSRVDETGQQARPSEVFEKVRGYLGVEQTEILSDLEDSDNVLDMLACRESAAGYMADAFRSCTDGDLLDEAWKQVLVWYENNHPEALERLKAGMFFDNRTEALGRAFADELYRGDAEKLMVSASKLERYSGCPFAYFVENGLRAKVPRIYEMAGREIGDLYHHCMMQLTKKLMPEKIGEVAINDPASPWMTVTYEECREMMREIIQQEQASYREGILEAGKAEGYKTARLTDTYSDAAWAMINQVRKGRIKTMYSEHVFGEKEALPPISVKVGEKEVLIRGQIDRLDVLEREQSKGEAAGGKTADPDGPFAVRIVDYKTGADVVNVDHMRKGYKIQLMTYLRAALAGKYDETGALLDGEADAEGYSAVPAGTFYFKIEDIDRENKSGEDKDDLGKQFEKKCRLQGVLVNEMDVMEAMDHTVQGGSTVIPVDYNKTKKLLVPSAKGSWFTREEMQELMEQVNEQVETLCQELCDGDISIRPKREKDSSERKTACKYCDYKGICMFDLSFSGCRYDWV